MEFEKITLEKENGIATLTLNHPEKMKAMTTEMYEDFRLFRGLFLFSLVFS